jgi:hypothetical protein
MGRMQSSAQARTSLSINGIVSQGAFSLIPNDFSLPEDFSTGRKRYELWTMRLPAEVDLDNLQGCKISLEPENSSTEFISDDKQYCFQIGSTIENKAFRLLIPRSMGLEDEEDSGYLIPFEEGFSRHINVIASIPIPTETQQAPRQGNAPAVVGKIRHAYEHVPQTTGLKRRWTPLGGSAGPIGEDEELSTGNKRKTNGKSDCGPGLKRIRKENRASFPTKQAHQSTREKDNDSDSESGRILKKEKKAKKEKKHTGRHKKKNGKLS